MTAPTAMEDNALTGARLDVYVSETEGVTRSFAQKLIDGGCVTVNGKAESKSYRVCQGDEIETDIPEASECNAEAQNIPLDIIFEDNDIIVINKPQGMVVHPAPGNPDGTLVNALLYHCGDSLSGIGGVMRPGIVHRIDRDTSGLLVASKTDAAHIKLSDMMKVHGVARIYSAIIIGCMKEEHGTIDAPIARHPQDRKRMAVIDGGRQAVTHYETARQFNGFSLLEVKLETGRTHQIRVHMAYRGHPVLGDPVYGGDKTDFERRHKQYFHGQCLHAGRLMFIHPTTGESMDFKAPPPENFTEILRLLELQ